MKHPLLIDTDTLQQRLGQPGLVVIDVRGKAAYEFGGHLRAPCHSTWHEYSDPNAVPKGLLNPDLGSIEVILRRLGLNQDSEVVIYSNPFDNWGDKGRVFWMLEYFGHTKLRVLDGGWVKWTAEKRPFEHGRVTPAPGNFKAQRVPARDYDKEDLKLIVRAPHPHTAILDARSLEEYLGKEVSGIPRPRSYSLGRSCRMERISEQRRHREKARRHQSDAGRQRASGESGTGLLLYGWRAVGMAVFCAEAGRV